MSLFCMLPLIHFVFDYKVYLGRFYSDSECGLLDFIYCQSKLTPLHKSMIQKHLFLKD